MGVLPVSVNVQPNTGVCEGFSDDKGERRRRSIVLAPIKLKVKGGDVTVSWTCNLAESCHNEECFYAKSKPEKMLRF